MCPILTTDGSACLGASTQLNITLNPDLVLGYLCAERKVLLCLHDVSKPSVGTQHTIAAVTEGGVTSVIEPAS